MSPSVASETLKLFNSLVCQSISDALSMPKPKALSTPTGRQRLWEHDGCAELGGTRAKREVLNRTCFRRRSILFFQVNFINERLSKTIIGVYLNLCLVDDQGGILW